MPIYEFHCKACRGEFRALRRSERLDDLTCPTCDSPRIARLLSVTAHTPSEAGAQAKLSDGPCGLPIGGGCCGGGCRLPA